MPQRPEIGESDGELGPAILSRLQLARSSHPKPDDAAVHTTRSQQHHLVARLAFGSLGHRPPIIGKLTPRGLLEICFELIGTHAIGRLRIAK